MSLGAYEFVLFFSELERVTKNFKDEQKSAKMKTQRSNLMNLQVFASSVGKLLFILSQ